MFCSCFWCFLLVFLFFFVFVLFFYLVYKNFSYDQVTFSNLVSSSSPSSYARRRCSLPSRKWLSSSAPPGWHRPCPSVVLDLATYPASEHHVIDSTVLDVLHTSDTPTLNVLYMWALSLLCPVLILYRMTCSGLFSLWKLSDWLKFGCCCFHLFMVRVLMMVFSLVTCR